MKFFNVVVLILKTGPIQHVFLTTYIDPFLAKTLSFSPEKLRYHLPVSTKSKRYPFQPKNQSQDNRIPAKLKFEKSNLLTRG